MFENDSRSSLRKWIFAALLAVAGVLLSPVFSFSFGSDPCFPAPAHDQYLSCGSLRHAVRYFRRLYHIGDQEYHRLRFAPRFPRLDDRRLPVGIPVQPHEKNFGQPSLENSQAHRSSAVLSLIRWPLSLWGRQKELFLYFSLFRFLRRRVPHCFHRPQRDPYLSNKYDKRKNNISFKIDFPRPSGLFLFTKMTAARLSYTICMYN